MSSKSVNHYFFQVPLCRTGAGHFEFTAKLGGRDVPVLLDTGSSKTVVDAGAARATGLTLVPFDKKGAGAGSLQLDLWTVEDATLEVEGHPLTPATGLMAMNLSHVIAALKMKGIAPPTVILGADILFARQAVIDYGKQRLHLAKEPPQARLGEV